MFNFLRNLRKSDEERRQEALSAYLDGALTPAEKKGFEQLLAKDKTLQAELQQQRMIKLSLGRLPRIRAPRNFTLDPARYGRPLPGTAERLYPIMRVATAAVAILFVLVLVLDLTSIGRSPNMAGEELAESVDMASEAMEAPAAAEGEPAVALEAEQAPVAEAVVEVTRIVEVVEEAFEMPAEELAAEEPAAEEPAAAAVMAEEEVAVEEAPVAEGEAVVVEETAEVEAPLPGPEEASGGGAPPPEGTPMAMAAPRIGEGVDGTTESQAAEDQAAGDTARSATAAVKVVTPTIDSGIALTEEAANQATPSLAPRTIPAPADGEGPAGDTATVEPGTDLSTTLILAIGLGLLLFVLVVVTLLLRRRAR